MKPLLLTLIAYEKKKPKHVICFGLSCDF